VIDSKWADIALQCVEPGDFASEGHQVIFQAVKCLRQGGRDSDVVNVCAELRRVNQPDLFEYAKALPVQDCWPERAAQRAQIVKQQSRLRRVIAVGGELRRKAFDGPDDPAAMIEAAIAELQEARQAWQPFQHAMPISFSEADRLYGDASCAWDPYLENGSLHIVCAPPEGGKSYFGLDLMRCFTTGADWPDGQENDVAPGNVLLVDYEATQRQYIDRARAAGLPLDLLRMQPPDCLPYLNQQGSFDLIRRWIEAAEARLVILDSWRDAAPGVNEDSSTEVSPTLQPLKAIARDFDIPVLVLHHPGKMYGATWTMQLTDLRGSGAFIGAARVIFGIDKPSAASEARTLKVMKRNSGPKPSSLGFEIGDAGLVWGAPTLRRRSRPRMDEAKAAIREALTPGPLTYGTLMAFCEKAGAKTRTVDSARDEMLKAGSIILGQDGRYSLAACEDG